MQRKTVICSICLNILFQPIVLPCSHEFCKDCLLKSVQYNSYQCPICRYRLSNWLRKIKDIDSVISITNENELRRLFPNYYQEKESGKSPCLSKSERKILDQLDQSWFDILVYTVEKKIDVAPYTSLSAPGDVYAEYIGECEKYSKMRLLQENQNEEASLALAAQLLLEDSFNNSHEFSVPQLDENHVEDKTLKVLRSTSFSKRESKNLKSSKRKHSLRKNSNKRDSTILEYAVDKHSSTHQSCSNSMYDQITNDEAFARKLQARYLKVNSTDKTKNTDSNY